MQKLNRIILIFLYLLTIITVVLLIYRGYEYYLLPIDARPHSLLHESFKPTGFIGHGIGVIGSLLMIVLLSYSLRKRSKFLRNKGNIRTWLNYHIWMGVTGPLLVTFHTSFNGTAAPTTTSKV